MNNTKAIMDAWKDKVADLLIAEAQCPWCTHLREAAIGTTMEAVCPEHKAQRVAATFGMRLR